VVRPTKADMEIPARVQRLRREVPSRRLEHLYLWAIQKPIYFALWHPDR